MAPFRPQSLWKEMSKEKTQHVLTRDIQLLFFFSLSQQTLSEHHPCAWKCVGSGDGGEGCPGLCRQGIHHPKALGPSRWKAQMTFTKGLAFLRPETLQNGSPEEYPATISWNRKCLRAAAILQIILFSLPGEAKSLMLHLGEYRSIIRTTCCRWK